MDNSSGPVAVLMKATGLLVIVVIGGVIANFVYRIIASFLNAKIEAEQAKVAKPVTTSDGFVIT